MGAIQLTYKYFNSDTYYIELNQKQLAEKVTNCIPYHEKIRLSGYRSASTEQWNHTSARIAIQPNQRMHLNNNVSKETTQIKGIHSLKANQSILQKRSEQQLQFLSAN